MIPSRGPAFPAESPSRRICVLRLGFICHTHPQGQNFYSVATESERTEYEIPWSRTRTGAHRARNQKSGQSAILVYGRRGVGKSEPIKQALTERGGCNAYCECRETSGWSNLESLSRLVSEALALPPLGFRNINGSVFNFYQMAQTGTASTFSVSRYGSWVWQMTCPNPTS